MNSKVLSKMYDQLTARERISLIVAASVREDVVERQRLLDSAPKVRIEVSHHYGLATALTEAADTHLLILLDFAASYWQWWGLWGWKGQRRQGQTAQEQGGAQDTEDFRLYCMVRYQAFLILAHIEGWKQFCGELSVDPCVLLDGLPGWDMVSRTEVQARERAFTRDEAGMFLLSETLLREGPEAEEFDLPEVLTVGGLAEDWHTFFERRAEFLLGQAGH